jgi:hypothetical protein
MVQTRHAGRPLIRHIENGRGAISLSNQIACRALTHRNAYRDAGLKPYDHAKRNRITLAEVEPDLP